MSQLPPTNPIETLNNSRQELQQAYEQVNHHFEQVYPLPKKFIEQTAPVVDVYLKRFSKPGASDDLFVFQALMGFMTQFDDFALMANQVFTEYDQQSKACKSYLDKISHLDTVTPELVNNELNPTVTDMRQQLSEVKSRSDEMLKKLETIETRWNKIKTRIKM